MQSNANRKLNMQKLLAPAALVILYVFFSIFGKNFFGYEGFKQILQSSYYIGFMAFGVTFVIITGGIDLSIGTVMMWFGHHRRHGLYQLGAGRCPWRWCWC